MSVGGDPQRADDVARVIVLPWRPPLLGELPDRPPAEVIAFPSRPEAKSKPPEQPPRLAV